MLPEHMSFSSGWRPGGSAGVSPHLRTWSLGSLVSVFSSKFSLPVAPSKITATLNSGLVKRVFGNSGFLDLLRRSSHSRWCDQGYRYLDPTDNLNINRYRSSFFKIVAPWIRTLDLPVGVRQLHHFTK